jgi:hypothetical protein
MAARRITLPTKTLEPSPSGLISTCLADEHGRHGGLAISARTMRWVLGSRSNMVETFRVEAPAPGLA